MNKIEKEANEANDIDVKKLTRWISMSSYDEKMSPKIRRAFRPNGVLDLAPSLFLSSIHRFLW